MVVNGRKFLQSHTLYFISQTEFSDKIGSVSVLSVYIYKVSWHSLRFP